METITITVKAGTEEQRLRVPGVESMQTLPDGTLEFVGITGSWICRVPVASQVADPQITRTCEL